MTFSRQQFEEMQVRLEKIAEREQALLKTLDEKLNRADQRLLNDVREITGKHEVRRATILDELQSLAEHIGAFPVAAPTHEFVAEIIEYEAIEVPRAEPPVPSESVQRAANGADWRQAAARIRDELDSGLILRATG